MGQEVLATTLALGAIIALRYLVVAGAAHWLFWLRAAAPKGAERLNRTRPGWPHIRHELRLSLLSSPIYALPAALAFEAFERGGTRVYTALSATDLLWAPLSLAIYLVAHDTFYYWAHRFMHLKAVHRFTHAGHHRSREPTPFASFSFDPAEAALTAWFIPALAFLVPIHAGVLLLLLMLMTVSAVLNHAGYEIWTPAQRESPLGRHAITAAHHARHHERFSCNYGLYFRFWDRWCGTDR